MNTNRDVNKEIMLEPVSFEYIHEGKDDWIDIKYRLSLGNRYMESYISEWSNDWDQIRREMESFFETGKTTINLFFEDEPTSIILEKADMLGGGISGIKRDVLKMEVIPDEFVSNKYDVFSGYAFYEDTINVLYKGLLGLTSLYPKDYVGGCSIIRDEAYSKMKSKMIEDFISGKSMNKESRWNKKTNGF